VNCYKQKILEHIYVIIIIIFVKFNSLRFGTPMCRL